MKRTFLLAAAFLLTGQAALALTTEQVVNDLRSQGYTRIEVRTGLTQTKVEAIRGTEKLEVVYDRATGAVLKSETDKVDFTDNTAPGVTLRNRNRDFVRVSSGDDAGSDDGDDTTRGREADDDAGGDDSDDRANDDNEDSGNDDAGNDDNGSDDSGSDDSGSDNSGSDNSDDD
jgi:hypothetical protein